MPYRDFPPVPMPDREPIEFTLGIAGEERFTVINEPTVGDIIELCSIPEPIIENEAQAVMSVARAIRRLLVPEDRPRFDRIMYQIPAPQVLPQLVAALEWMVDQTTPFVGGHSES